jgi:hypothetical protein
LVMISANGLTESENNDIVNNVVTLNALFDD